MEKSESIKNIATSLIEFQSKVQNVKKDGSNPYFKSKYATLENILDTIKPTLKECGLSFSQFPDGDGLTTILMDESGEYLKATVRMTPVDNKPQSQGSAITYMRRYSLSAVLGIAVEDDDDGNAASQPTAPSSPPVGAKKSYQTIKTDKGVLKKRNDGMSLIYRDGGKADPKVDSEFIEEPPIEL